ncbi:Scr1 family TA system antitoxin-like transcriptional regulator [Streptomyces sp. NPDC002476]|uniref:Scr1 family TA system antitoxin-like transcriptional regulator n=1 Tax=Streptomyces sp. NPDC002476 TaxID=3364648 RepID=UPI0036BC46F6
MLHTLPSPPPTKTSQPPARIVAGVYLRCLRRANGVMLKDSARAAGVSVPAIIRWEQAEAPVPPAALRRLLLRYGVPGDHADYMARRVPPQPYVRDAHEERGFARRAPYDSWTDVAGAEAMARYMAVMLMADEVVQYTTGIPPGLRTEAYRGAVLGPGVCPGPDEPVIGMPRWVHKVPRAEGQRCTVLLDETVLTRPVGGPTVMADQLRHLSCLPSQEAPGGRMVTVRILPVGYVGVIHTLGEVAEVTVHGRRMLTSLRLGPSYETGSGFAHVMGEGMRSWTQPHASS